MSVRTLAIVPILHTQADLGGVGDAVRQRTLERSGRAAWERKRRAIEALWSRIEAWAASVEIAEPPLRVFQDGLPVCATVHAIVEELAAQGSANHRVLRTLVERGAELVGTESAELLLEEYERVRNDAQSPGRVRDESTRANHGDTLLERRDRFIASRIDGALPPSGAGVLFVGLLHEVERYLPDDIRTYQPFEIADALRAGAA